jgi:hypothetical protein
MKRTLNLLLVCLIAALITKIAAAQNPDPKINTALPKIMVIPFVKEGEDMRTILDKDFNKRMAIAKVKNGFDNRGYTTKDFGATLKLAIDNKAFITGTQSDVKSAIIELSGADIYVEVDVHATASPSGNSAKVLISAYDAATASAYATVNCDSREHYDTDNARLIDVALSVPMTSVRRDERVSITAPVRSTTNDAPPCLDQFLNILQAKFDDIAAKGRPINLDFSIDAAAARTFDSKVAGANNKQLSDIIDDWLAENAYKNNYHMQGTSPSRLFYDEVRIPLYDANGRNYNLNTFARKLSDFLNAKGVTTKRAIKNGGIFITVQN